MLRRTLGSRGRKGEGGCYICGVLHEEGAHLRRGVHHHLWEAILRGGSYYKGQDKGKARAKVKQEQSQSKGIRKKTKASKGRKAHQGKGRLTSQG
jgi:hypothetical protein